MTIFRFFQCCIISILLMGILGTFENSLADIQLPYDRVDSGLDVIPQGNNLVLENAPDKGSKQIVDTLITVFHTMKWFLGFFVLAWIIYAGIYMVTASTSEDSVGSAKKMVLYGITGLVVMLLVPAFVLDIFYGGGEAGVSYENSGINDIKAASDNLRLQISGVIEFFKTLLVFIAMGYVIMAGIRMILAFGEEEKLGTAKGMFLPIGVGILVILFNEVFIDYILYDIAFEGGEVDFSPDSSEASIFVEQLIGFLQYILQFIALLVFGFMVYGGFLYIISFGNEESANKGKQIFINAAIGMVILIFSYILMMSLVNFSITV